MTKGAYEKQRVVLLKSQADQDYKLLGAVRNGTDCNEHIDTASDHELENELIADTLQLANKIRKADNACPTKVSPELAFNTGEKIDHWLQNFDDKESPAIEHKIADTSDFFKNLPNLSLVVGRTSQELKSALQNVFFWELMEDDNDRQKSQTGKKAMQSNHQSEIESNRSKKKEKRVKQCA